MKNFQYLAIAYAFIWIALFVYLVSLWRRHGEVGRKVDQLIDAVDSTKQTDKG